MNAVHFCAKLAIIEKSPCIYLSFCIETAHGSNTPKIILTISFFRNCTMH